MGAAAFELSAGSLEKLQALDGLVSRWAKAVDLVGFKSQDAYYRRYFGEALASLPWLPETGRAFDIGSGGGSPALPLAVVRAGVAWTMIESNARKGAFLDEAIRVLELRGSRVVIDRYEDVALDAPADVVTMRGVAADRRLLAKVAADLRPGGRFLWFSSEARLRQARGGLESPWRSVEGPLPLTPSGGFLLVADVGA